MPASVNIPVETVLEIQRSQAAAVFTAHAADVARRDQRIAELEAELESVRREVSEAAIANDRLRRQLERLTEPPPADAAAESTP